MEKFIKLVKKLPNKSKGFTLIELLIYMGISTIIVVVLTSFMVDVLKNATKTKITKEVQQNARILLTRITQEIRNAKAITIQTPQRINLIDPLDNIITICLANDNAVHYLKGVGDCTNTDTNILSSAQVTVTQLNFSKIANSNTIIVGLKVEEKNTETTLSSAFVPRITVY